MASQEFTDRGGTEAEYRIWRELFATGRKEPDDFIFNAGDQFGVSFQVLSPRVGIKIINTFNSDSGINAIAAASSGVSVKLIQERDAINSPGRALSQALGG